MTALEVEPLDLPEPEVVVVRPPILTSVGVDVRQTSDGSRYYHDVVRDRLLASVTTAIASATSKLWLVDWAAKLAAQTAVDEFPTLVGMLSDREDDTPQAVRERKAGAVDYLKGAAKRKREAAAEAGTWIHDVVEALVLDAPMPEFPPEVEASAWQFIEWHLAFQPIYLASEATVANPARGHAGTLDIIAYVPCLGMTFLIDCKSGANLDVWMAAQLSAYRNSTEVWLPGGQRTAMPQVDACAVLHLRPEGYKFIEVPTADDEAYGVFLRMLEQLDWRDRQPKSLGRVLYVPLEDGSQPPPLLEDLDGVPARSALAEAGIVRLDHLAAADPAGLLDLYGFGPKSLALVAGLLVRHDLDASAVEQHLAVLDEQDRAKAEAALARKRVKHARAHPFIAGTFGCAASGLNAGEDCGLDAASHEAPKRAPRKATPKASA